MSAETHEPLILSRRAVLRSVAAVAAMGSLPARAATPLRIVSLDYGIASTLLSLGVVPVGVSELADWDKWIVEPRMPEGVIDLGSSFEVNFEILVALKPDLILSTPYLDDQRTRLETVSRVLQLQIFAGDGGPVLPAAIAATRRLGSEIGRSKEADDYLAGSDAFFEGCRRRLQRIAPPPVVLVNFMDARHARVYGSPGLFDNVLGRIGVRNAWEAPSNYWGYQTIAIEELSRITDPRAKLIAFDPVPGDVLPKLRQSPLWQALPFSRTGNFAVLPSTLMFGMVNEAMRFGRLITEFLEKSA